MTIYTFNLLVGYEPNGVDVAQASRAIMLRQLQEPARFVFTTWPSPQKLAYYLSLGHKDEELLYAYLSFTDQATNVPSVTVGALQMDFQLTRLDLVKKTETEAHYQFSNNQSLVFTLDPYHRDCVRYVDYLVRGSIVKREWYGAKKMVTEYFVGGTIVRRTYHHQDGKVAFQEIKQGEQWFYQLGTEILLTQTQVLERFLARLNLGKEDILLLDRASLMDFTRPILEQKTSARLGFVFHSEHEFLNGSLNYEYYYVFKYMRRFDFLLVATELQKEVLLETFKKQGIDVLPIYVLPVGHLDQLQQPSSPRQPLSMMTASRLDPRKRIDLAIRAVALAHQKVPGLQFHIFGKGGEEPTLRQLIQDFYADDYILLRGHADLDSLYPQFQVYVTTSQWETFGLTLMEAVGSGLALVGFDARYGNPTFIQDGKNGYLVPYGVERNEEDLVADMADKLVSVLENDLESMHQTSYKIARTYLRERVVQAWRQVLDGLREDLSSHS